MAKTSAILSLLDKLVDTLKECSEFSNVNFFVDHEKDIRTKVQQGITKTSVACVLGFTGSTSPNSEAPGPIIQLSITAAVIGNTTITQSQGYKSILEVAEHVAKHIHDTKDCNENNCYYEFRHTGIKPNFTKSEVIYEVGFLLRLDLSNT